MCLEIISLSTDGPLQGVLLSPIPQGLGPCSFFGLAVNINIFCSDQLQHFGNKPQGNQVCWLPKLIFYSFKKIYSIFCVCFFFYEPYKNYQGTIVVAENQSVSQQVIYSKKIVN